MIAQSFGVAQLQRWWFEARFWWSLSCVDKGDIMIEKTEKLLVTDTPRTL
jgi:hypothetical protein